VKDIQKEVSFMNKLSISNLLEEVKNSFNSSVSKYDKKRKGSTSTLTYAMSCLAIFYFKWPSLLEYEKNKSNENVRNNITKLFGLEEFPSDTQMRERLDEINPKDLRSSFKKIFSMLQRNKYLEGYKYLNDSYLVSIDGTGYFSSSKIHCKNCCEKNHRNGNKTYHHQMLGASIVHPGKKEVIPFAPEAILKQDGSKKNDCERNASKRFLQDLRREHPHLKLTVVEDGLSSNAPHLKLLEELKMSYIVSAKETDHKFLFDWVKSSETQKHEYIDEKGTKHEFLFVNKVPLNDNNFDFEVNFLDYWETKKDGRKQHFTWVTDIVLKKENIFQVMKGGRARWKIENETFNTLKNQGYNFEHNYGHGKNHLSTNMAMIMFLAFLIDQTQQICCKLFQRLRYIGNKCIRIYRTLWETFRVLVKFFVFETFEDMYLKISSTDKIPP
jgi:hypothetical protein